MHAVAVFMLTLTLAFFPGPHSFPLLPRLQSVIAAVSILALGGRKEPAIGGGGGCFWTHIKRS